MIFVAVGPQDQVRYNRDSAFAPTIPCPTSLSSLPTIARMPIMTAAFPQLVDFLRFTHGFVVVFVILVVADCATGKEPWREALTPFLSDFCLDCHSGDDPQGGLNFPGLSHELEDAESIRRWTMIHDRIAAGEMPPPDAALPDDEDRSAAVRQLSAALLQADVLRRDVVLRRLNRNEYENSVRDLFGVEVRLKELLPQDTSMAGFDNVGEGLAVSPEALQAYLQAADVALDAVFGPPQPPKVIRHTTNLLEQTTHDGKPYLDDKIGKMFRKTDHGLVIFQSGYCPTNLVNFARLRPPAGTYRGTLQVRAIQSEQPVTLRIYGGDTIVGRREKHVVGYYDVPPGDWTTIEFTDRLVEDGGTFQPTCYGTRDTRKDADSYPEPGIEIGTITLEGPLEPWPPPSRQRLLGGTDIEDGTLDDARLIFEELLPRAFRHPVEAGEVESILGLTEMALAEERSFEDALRLGIKGILCSPQFLFLDEPGRQQIGQHALATRLSYFLWSSLPDDTLRALVDDGRLDDPRVLREQVERMLADPKSTAFTSNFVGQWLDLRDIDFTSPDMELYPEFDELLRLSMIEETHRFYRELLDHDRSVMNFVDSDFTFLNQRLAAHYGIPDIRGQEFRKVTLPEASVRGGVLTQASVLKVTANGTNTSPVMRGVWVLENLLGQTVPPPPAAVPAVEPDIRGATTIREQLAKHRSDESCAQCHRLIDPAGFALENFDVIGGWRDHYRTLGDGERPEYSQDPHTFAWVRFRFGSPVDASGTTADGERFEDIRHFKRILLSQERAVATGLTEKLLTYALGRGMGFSDRAEIENIVQAIAEKGYGLRTLIHQIVQSDLFRRP